MRQGKIWVMTIGLIAAPGAILAQETTTINFDDKSGQTEFSEGGANFSGGIAQTEGIPALYSSGAFAYSIETDEDVGEVVFDQPVDNVRFFFVHEAGAATGTATAFNATNNEIAMVNSNAPTTFADPNNFVTMDPAQSIARVEFRGAGLMIDDFSFTLQSGPPAINFGHNGTWSNPETDGQGFFIDVIPSRDEVVASWFTFDPTGGGQRWFTALGPFEGNRAELTLFETTGGVFNDPTEVVTTEVGTLVIEFQDCTNGTVSFNITDEGSEGTIPISKLAPDVLCNSFANGSVIVRE